MQGFVAQVRSAATAAATVASGSRGGQSTNQSSDQPERITNPCLVCMERFYYMVVDAVGSSDPEEKRRRDFKQVFEAMLNEGSMFVLMDYLDEKPSGIVSQVSKSVTSFLGGRSLTTSAGTRTGLTVKSDNEGAGSQIFVQLDDTKIVWKSMELNNNKPKYEGCVPLHKVQIIQMKNNVLECLDDHANILLSFKQSQGENPNVLKTWENGLKEALIVLSPEIDSDASESRGLLHRQQKYLELEERKRQREAQKQKLGKVGMKYTAQAMMSKN